ncbi:hypothetical protein RQP46_004209 [Phenoliferia psychrophenolica]
MSSYLKRARAASDLDAYEDRRADKAASRSVIPAAISLTYVVAEALNDLYDRKETVALQLAEATKKRDQATKKQQGFEATLVIAREAMKVASRRLTKTQTDEDRGRNSIEGIEGALFDMRVALGTLEKATKAVKEGRKVVRTRFDAYGVCVIEIAQVEAEVEEMEEMILVSAVCATALAVY